MAVRGSGTTSIKLDDQDTIEENEGIFLVTLDENSKCPEFREWWNSRSRPPATSS